MCVFTSYYADVLHSFCALVVGLNQPLSHPYTLTSICPPLALRMDSPTWRKGRMGRGIERGWGRRGRERVVIAGEIERWRGRGEGEMGGEDMHKWSEKEGGGEKKET